MRRGVEGQGYTRVGKRVHVLVTSTEIYLPKSLPYQALCGVVWHATEGVNSPELNELPRCEECHIREVERLRFTGDDYYRAAQEIESDYLKWKKENE